MPTLSPSNCINVEHQGVAGGKFLRRRERLVRSGLVRLSVSTERSGAGSWRVSTVVRGPDAIGAADAIDAVDAKCVCDVLP